MIPTKCILIVACVLICISALVTPVCNHLVLAKLERVEFALTRKEVVIMAEIETTWRSAKGNKRVKTTKMDKETDEEHSTRHDLAVDAEQAKNPIIP